MAAKTMLVPAAALSGPARVDFLRLEVGPGEGPDPLQALGHPGLEQAGAAARRAWALFPPPVRAAVQVANPGLPLTNSAGAGLALALCPFLLGEPRPYRVALAMGCLAFPPGGGVDLSGADRLLDKLEALRQRGYRVEPELLILPWDGLDEAEDRALGGLAALNVAVRRVNDFEEACRACDGRLC